MTKNEIALIAKVIKDNTEWYKGEDDYGEYIEATKIDPHDIMASFGLAFKKVNPDFDYFEFVDACKKPYPEDWKRK